MSSDTTLILIAVGLILYAVFTMWVLLGGADELIYRIKHRKDDKD